MTKQLYYEDSYQKEFEAEVLACEPVGKQYRVLLDQTAFFPEGGGQSSDTGTIDGAVVHDVREKDGWIYHIVDNSFVVGRNVRGVLDFKERFTRMQQHSGEHIVSGLIHQLFGLDNVGFHLGADAVTMDFNGVITKEQMRQLEYKANEAVSKNLEIKVSYPAKMELEQLDYRSKIDIIGRVRIVTIEGYDVCACCAPHMARTGEIGLIKLTELQNHRGGVRISMVCGFRALQDFQEKETSVKEISVLLSSKESQVADNVARIKNENLLLKSNLSKLQRQLIQYRAEEIPGEQEMVCLFEPELHGDAPREFVNLLLKKNIGVVAVFADAAESGFRYIVGSRTMDVRKIAAELNRTLNGRGGGKTEMVQGSVIGSCEEIQRVMEKIRTL